MTKSVKTIRLGSHETRLLFELERLGRKVFTLQEASEILELSKALTANVLYRLKRKGRVLQVEKGKYILIPARAGIEGYWAEDIFLVVDKLISEYYIGFLTAMHYWDLTEQIPYAILVATPRRKAPVKLDSETIRFVTIRESRFFGFQEARTEHGTFKI
jgi:predicted transcriptional regulator of viral defense system